MVTNPVDYGTNTVTTTATIVYIYYNYISTTTTIITTTTTTNTTTTIIQLLVLLLLFYLNIIIYPHNLLYPCQWKLEILPVILHNVEKSLVQAERQEKNK